MSLYQKVNRVMIDGIEPGETSPTENLSHIHIMGREAIYMQVQQHMMDTTSRQALAYIGYPGTGKTALLRQLPMYVDLAIISVFLPIAELTLENEDALLTRFVIRTNQVMSQYDYSMSRIPSLSDDEDSPPMRDWLKETYLPEVLHIIRGQRRLVWLLDDFDLLLDAIDKNTLPDDFVTFLQELLVAYPPFGIVLTADTDAESRLLNLGTFLSTSSIHRLQSLPQEAGLAMLQDTAPYFSEGDLKKLYQATGGHALWLARAANALDPTATISEIIDYIYKHSTSDIAAIWARLSPNEQTILQAIAERYYQDPLSPVTLADVTQWVINSDASMDSTDIHSALRGLEYRELILTGENIQIRSELVRRWLLSNQPHDATVNKRQTNEAQPSSIQLNWRWIAVIILLIVIILAVAAYLGQPPTLDGSEALPTVTFSS
ncbi:hypothetical protein G4Y79_21440 [Phototrophicus methaneseepsis]|uniref:Uncharacterized protein n=1 Tax=Phototrophicus methaneseepsis TaxID=2710758 RepID=A0A7S8E8B8_9CHLR|nr:hypothetical protein [Phototrophicus methaneseepsis]QPC82222.1 hypothetical protein G4Y79_21440 [Phototrophicus methaneseepsis]